MNRSYRRAKTELLSSLRAVHSSIVLEAKTELGPCYDAYCSLLQSPALADFIRAPARDIFPLRSNMTSVRSEYVYIKRENSSPVEGRVRILEDGKHFFTSRRDLYLHFCEPQIVRDSEAMRCPTAPVEKGLDSRFLHPGLEDEEFAAVHTLLGLVDVMFDKVYQDLSSDLDDKEISSKMFEVSKAFDEREQSISAEPKGGNGKGHSRLALRRRSSNTTAAANVTEGEEGDTDELEEYNRQGRVMSKLVIHKAITNKVEIALVEDKGKTDATNDTRLSLRLTSKCPTMLKGELLGDVDQHSDDEHNDARLSVDSHNNLTTGKFEPSYMIEGSPDVNEDNIKVRNRVRSVHNPMCPDSSSKSRVFSPSIKDDDDSGN